MSKSIKPFSLPIKKAPVSTQVKKATVSSSVKKAGFTPSTKISASPAKKPLSIKKESTSNSVVNFEFSQSPNFAFGLVGSDIEAGEFDPFGLSVGKNEETLKWYRAAELKHARICMLAFLGLAISPLIQLPDPVFQTTGGFSAVTSLMETRPEAIWQILLGLAAIETSSLFKNGQGEAGDYNWDPLNFKSKYGLDDENSLRAMQLRELKNGRLAMLGTSALLLQEYVDGKGQFEQIWGLN